MLRDSVVVRTRPRAFPLPMITMRKLIHGFLFPIWLWGSASPLGGPSGRRSSAKMPAATMRMNMIIYRFRPV